MAAATASGDGNPYLLQVLAAEDKAAKQIADAKEKRVTMMTSAQTQAKKEADEYRQQEERQFQVLLAKRASEGNEILSQLEESSKQEIVMVKKDFKSNRDAVTEFLMDHALHIELNLNKVQQRYLAASAQGNTKGYI